jgi:death-on-curing protein
VHYGGSEGIRDFAVLQSAVAMPAAGLGGQFFRADPCEMAAAYLFHIVQNHPFIDGNERVGAVAAFVFLALNNMRLTADQESYADLVLSVARGETAKSAVAEFFRANIAPAIILTLKKWLAISVGVVEAGVVLANE